MSGEFAHRVRLDKLGAAPSHFRLEATPEERTVLAERFGLQSVGSLLAEMDVRRTAEGAEAVGRVRAQVVQSCSVSGAPVPATVDEEVRLRFVPPAEGEELELSEEDLDAIPFWGDCLELGDAVADSMALALDPFPRADEATLAEARRKLMTEEQAEALHEAERQSRSPFAKLRPN